MATIVRKRCRSCGDIPDPATTLNLFGRPDPVHVRRYDWHVRECGPVVEETVCDEQQRWEALLGEAL